MTQPQVWTMMGVFTTLMFGTLTIISTLFVRVVRAEVGSVRAEIGGVRTEVGSVRAEIGGVRTEVDGVRAEIGGVRSEVDGVRSEIGGLRNEMNARFLSVDTRLEGLDRDVQALVKKNFGLDRG